MKIQRAQTTLLTTESKNFLALLQLGILSLQVLIFVFILLIAGRQNQLARRRPTMAQLVNGDTVYISEKDRYWRYPQVIRKVVSDWTMLTFNWEGKIAGSDKTDEGVKVDDRQRVPTNTWFASVLLEDDFAQAALKDIAQLVPADVFTGRIRSVAIVNHVSEPRQIAQGRWQVDMVSTRILIDRTGKSERLPFNRTFTLEAVEIPHSPLGSDASLVEQRIYEIRSAGLQIINIVPFEPKGS
ncbi:hypothetical protein [Gloeocapsopsis sp. IPPAS B-1203]|uniref:hypothetical protein n=1 Tax=Gloeocapsopsis sp. IPPAS B-1203 TaxID=2049454 RepID=UPI000C1A4EDB|nr:hypothetical protein [Gloeocapsopsis sp. IPPAS B-1203]PIG91584.1 hypothetical protein CSQ79_20295 [Gloeocapsopsis sp. IPPAS B-1203]